MESAVLLFFMILNSIFVILIGIPLAVNLWFEVAKKIREKGNWGKLKSKFFEYIEEAKNKKFRQYLDFFNLIIISILLLFHKEFYLLIYLPLFLITRFFASLVRSILERSYRDKGISEFWFFIFVSLFCLLIFSYIVTFSFFYSTAHISREGYFLVERNPRYLDVKESIFYSAYTFFGMNYAEVIPKGSLNFFTILESFVAEILIITFIGIVAGELVAKLKLKKVGVQNE